MCHAEQFHPAITWKCPALTQTSPYITKKSPTCTTGWRRLIGSPKLQIILHKRATKYRSLLRKMTYKDKASYESSPPCTQSHTFTIHQTARFHLQPIHFTKSPAFNQKTSPFTQKSPVFTQKSPVFTQKSPVFTQKTSLFTQKSPVFTHNSPTLAQKKQKHLHLCKTATHCNTQ